MQYLRHKNKYTVTNFETMLHVEVQMTVKSCILDRLSRNKTGTIFSQAFDSELCLYKGYLTSN